MRVIKLGGSLLDWPDWPERFHCWLMQQPAAGGAVVVGGGARANRVREMDRAQRLGDSAAHRMAIEAMRANAADVCRLLLAEQPPRNNGAPLLACRAVEPSRAASTAGQASSGTHQISAVGPPEPAGPECWATLLERIGRDELAVLEPVEFMAHIEPSAAGRRLPESWDVTSDSIAARLATVLGADELVLLKSALPPAGALECEALAAAGYVDRCFPEFAAGIRRIRCVDLRSADFAEREQLMATATSGRGYNW